MLLSQFPCLTDIMRMQGDFDLNSVQIYPDSLREALKKTMLSQEVIFRKQVEELHRLYMTQKTLMDNIAWIEFDRYNLRKASTQSSLLCSANLARYEAHMKETAISSIPMADPKQSTSHMSLEGHQGVYYNLWQGPQDLQLPSDQYFSNVDPELKLSLSSAEGNWRERSAKRNWFDKKVPPCPHNIIDLEESILRVSNESEQHAPSFSHAALTTHSGGERETGFSILSDPVISCTVKKDLPDKIAHICPLLDDHKCCQEKNYLKKELKDFHFGTPSNNLSTKMRQPSLFKAAHLDLNKVQLDDSSCCSNDLLVAHPSTASSAHVFIELFGRVQEDNCASMTWIKENENCSNEASDILHQDDAVNSLIDSNSKSKITEIWASTSKFNGLCGSEVGLCEDLGGHGSEPNNGNVGFLLEPSKNLLHDPNGMCIASGQMNFEKSEEDIIILASSSQSQSTVQGGRGNVSPASCKSQSNVDNDSSSVKTMQSGIEIGSSNLSPFDQFSGNHVGCQVAETLSGNQDQRSFDSSESKHECHNKEESSEADALIHWAAESLVHFSLEIASGNQDCSAKAELTEMKNEGRDQPQCSSDSFELIALNLKECNVDEYSVSSKPFEVNDMETTDFSSKLRRGRRLKDFQKDILPGLASLSRQEIREDINILEGVLRSREYRKIRARMADGQSWCAPVRSRRSRLNYVRRKKI
ncbi:hypothetical protein F2P56_005020 [Juglans regia]|uniref:Uncharacterized protein n=3 Tax=Juglans regia TaxID=51240 RepID=A0A834D8N3_JUGRE|nr:uncharacterized protein LOC109011439 isoform X1 [Juglans regia]KAF5478461.1 hypothetical protein F2P56_005020 [Juglans regia]